MIPSRRSWSSLATVVALLSSTVSLLLPLLVVVDARGDVHENFIDEVVTSVRAMSGTFAPNPRNGGKPMMILNSKDGKVNALEDPDNSPDAVLILDLEGDQLCENGERGLHTVIPHPNFNVNGNYWMYAFYTSFRNDCSEDMETGPWNVVVRFPMDPDTLMLDNDGREEIWRGAPLSRRIHNGGAMAFGNDGLLYITTGDADVRDHAQRLDHVHGKIIRLADDGSVPDVNPFTAASGYDNSYRCADSGGMVPDGAPDDAVCSEIFANGLRNPFRITMDVNVQDKVVFTVGAVGAQHMESLYYGGTDYMGANYGWPIYEGVCKPADMSNCPGIDDTDYVVPFHWYEHINPSGNGGCVAGQAFVPEGIWPDEFKYLFIDFIFLKVYQLQTDLPQRACNDCLPPLPPTRNVTFYRSIQEDPDNANEARMTAMWFGPYQDTQALYIVKFGATDTVLRIRYNGALSKPPEPAFDFQYTTDLSVQFDASASYDPENLTLSYYWDFGDGQNATGIVAPTHDYAGPGEYTVTLVIADSEGQEQQLSKIVQIGVRPIVTILSPTISDFFTVGQVLRLSGEAVDNEGNVIADDMLEWEVRQHHADHYHPFLDVRTGNNFDLYPAPPPEDYIAATNSYLEVILTATDQNGLTSTVNLEVQPKVILVDLETVPVGLSIVAQSYILETPEIITSWIGFDLPLVADDQPPYVFQKWSDGVTDPSRTLNLTSDLTESKITAYFCVDQDNECTGNDECCTGHCNGAGVCAVKPTAEPPATESQPPVPPPTQPPDSGVTIETPADQDDDVIPPSEDGPWTPMFDDTVDFDSDEDNVSSVQQTETHSSNSSNTTDSFEVTIIVLLTLSVALFCCVLCYCYFNRRANLKDSEYFDSIIDSLQEKPTRELGDNSSKTSSDDDVAGCGVEAVATGSIEEYDKAEGAHFATSRSRTGDGQPLLRTGDVVVDGTMGVFQFLVDPLPPMPEHSFASRDLEAGEFDPAESDHETDLFVEADSFDEDGIVDSRIIPNGTPLLVDSSAFENSAIEEDLDETRDVVDSAMDDDLGSDMNSSCVDGSVVEGTVDLLVADEVSSEAISTILLADASPSKRNQTDIWRSTHSKSVQEDASGSIHSKGVQEDASHSLNCTRVQDASLSRHSKRVQEDASCSMHTQRVQEDASCSMHTQRVQEDASHSIHSKRVQEDASRSIHSKRVQEDASRSLHSKRVQEDASRSLHSTTMDGNNSPPTTISENTAPTKRMQYTSRSLHSRRIQENDSPTTKIHDHTSRSLPSTRIQEEDSRSNRMSKYEDEEPSLDGYTAHAVAADETMVSQISDHYPEDEPPELSDEMDDTILSYMSEYSNEDEHVSTEEPAALGTKSDPKTCGPAPHDRDFDFPVTSTPLPKTSRGSGFNKLNSSPIGADTPETATTMTPTPNGKRVRKPWASDMRLVSSDLADYRSAVNDLEEKY